VPPLYQLARGLILIGLWFKFHPISSYWPVESVNLQQIQKAPISIRLHWLLLSKLALITGQCALTLNLVHLQQFWKLQNPGDTSQQAKWQRQQHMKKMGRWRSHDDFAKIFALEDGGRKQAPPHWVKFHQL
jgi:hypothetical protein